MLSALVMSCVEASLFLIWPFLIGIAIDDFDLLWFAVCSTMGSLPRLVEIAVDYAKLYCLSISFSSTFSVSLPRDISLLCKESLLYDCWDSFFLNMACWRACSSSSLIDWRDIKFLVF